MNQIKALSLIWRGRRKERSEFLLTTTGCSAAGSARGLGPRCRRFESCHSDQRQNDTIRSPAAAGGVRSTDGVVFPFQTGGLAGVLRFGLNGSFESVMNTQTSVGDHSARQENGDRFDGRRFPVCAPCLLLSKSKPAPLGFDLVFGRMIKSVMNTRTKKGKSPLVGLLPFSVAGFECVIVTASGGYI